MFKHRILAAAWLLIMSATPSLSSGMVLRVADRQPGLSYTVTRLNGMLVNGTVNFRHLSVFDVDSSGNIKILDGNGLIFTFNIHDVLFKDNPYKGITPGFYCMTTTCIAIYNTDNGFSQHVAHVAIWPSDSNDITRLDNACKRLSEIFGVVEHSDPFDSH